MKLLILSLLSLKTAFAAYIPIQGKVPPEFHHIIATLKTTELYLVHQKEINSLIPLMDRAFSSLDDTDVHLIIKSEIFKTLLQSPPSSKRSFRSLAPDMLKGLHLLSKKTDSPFFAWLALSIHADLKSLIHSPLFPAFKKQIQSPTDRWNPSMILMKKKFALLLPWHDYLTTTPQKQLAEKIYPLLLKCLRQIHFKSTRYASLVPMRPPIQDQLQYFEKTSPIKKKKSLDSLLDPIIDDNKKVVLPEPVDDWTPKKDDYSQNLPRPTDDWLPEPVDDWNL